MTIDILVVGAGHNGLVCAFYLASAGLKVKLVERRDVGGAAVTQESHPGFRNSVATYTASLLNPKVIADMNLSVRGLTVVERRASNFLLQPDGRSLLTGPGRTSAELAKFSIADADAHPRHSDEIDAIADVLRDLVLKPPPNVVEGGLILERIFGLIDGDIFHGALSLDQLFSARPMLGYADCRPPLKGLYMCGSRTRPGGGVTGAPDHNAARTILRDFRSRFA